MNPPLFWKYKKSTIVISLLVIADVLFYAFGIFTPFLTLKKFFMFNEQITLVGSIILLFKSKQTALGIIVLIFSIIFPIIKLLILIFIWFITSNKENAKKWLNRIEVIGNWSMLDVFVVAITIVAIKLSGLGDMRVHYGLYLFAASVLLTKFTLMLIHRVLARHK